MPSIFKALATITAWILFIFGLLALLGGFARIIGASIGPLESPDLLTMSAYFGYGVGGLVLSVVVMRLRQKME